MSISANSSLIRGTADPMQPLVAVQQKASAPALDDTLGTLAQAVVIGSSRDAVGAAGSRLRCEVVTDFHRLEELSGEWERLWLADSKAEIFQSFIWARAWWQCFGSGLKLCTPVIYERDEVVLILPLVQCGDTIGFLGAPQADYGEVLCAETRVVELLTLALETLLQSVHGWRECVLQNLPAHGRIVTYRDQLPPELRSLLQLEPATRCPTILFEGKRDEVLAPLLGKKHLRRRQNKMEKAGRVSFRLLENRAEAQEQLTQFFQCHRRRCAVVAKTSAFEDPGMRDLMRALVEQLDLHSQLRFGVLEMNGQAMAWSLGFHVNGKFVFYQQTFDLDAAEYAPGEVLLYHLLLYAKENVEREFDFARGDEFFKSRFATHTLQSWNLYFERPGVRGRVRRLSRAVHGRFHRLEERIEGAVRTHEVAFHTFRSVRVWKTNVLGGFRQAQENAKLTEYFFDSGVDLFRATVWAKQEVILFHRGGGTRLGTLPEFQPADGQPADGETKVTAGRFSDLVDLSLEHPGLLPASLSECRDRLKKGDRVYLVRGSGRIELVAWTGTRELNDLLTLRHCKVETGAPAMTVYEYWAVPGFDPVAGYAKLLSHLTREAVGADMDLLVCCSGNHGLMRAELERQGFRPKRRVVRRKVLHWVRHDSVRDLPALGSNGSATDN
jgi:CelD/BcsL family acetyltransferase involved in cellulose biosynthesis